MINNIENPATVTGAGTDSENQVIGTKIKFVKIEMRSGRQNDKPEQTRIRYERWEKFEKIIGELQTTSLSVEFRKNSEFQTWTNVCLKTDVRLHDIHHGSRRISIYSALEADSRAKALLDGKTIVIVSSVNGNDSSYRCFIDYSECQLIDGFVVGEKLYEF